ncbi:hypothetical protein AAVH_27247 [Aphelenchoides avenae]|nr:hypothetical protein AAVH_27247 [Aphelenchus avenae]
MGQLQLLVLTVVVGVALCAVQGLNAPRHRHQHPHNVTNARRNGTDAAVGHVNLATNLTEFANSSLPLLFGHHWNVTGSDTHRANATLPETMGARHNHTGEISLRRGHGHPHNVTNARTNVTNAVVGQHVNLATNLTAFVNGSLDSLIGHRWNMTGSDAHRANATLRDTAVASHNHTGEISLRRGHGHPHNVTNARSNRTDAVFGQVKLATNLTAFASGSLESLIGRHWNATDVEANATLLGSTGARHNLTNDIIGLAGNVTNLLRHNYTSVGSAYLHNATILGEAVIRGNHSERANVTDVLRSNVTSLHELTDAHHPGNGTVLVKFGRRANYTEDGFQRRHHRFNSTNFHVYNASRIQPHDWNLTAFEQGAVKFNATAQLANIDLRARRHPHPRNATKAH